MRVSARVPRTLHRALLLETWRREALGETGDTLASLLEIAVERLGDDLTELDRLLTTPSVRKALAAPTEVHMQPRVSEDHADLIVLFARSASFHGNQTQLVSERHVIVAALLGLLRATAEAHDPYTAPRHRRDDQLRHAATAVLGHNDTATQGDDDTGST